MRMPSDRAARTSSSRRSSRPPSGARARGSSRGRARKSTKTRSACRTSAHVRCVAAERRERARERVGRRGIVEAAEQLVEQRRLRRGGHARLVLERVGDAAEEIRRQHRATERARKHADAEREGARHGRQDLAREALGLRHAGIAAASLRGSVGAPLTPVRLLDTWKRYPASREAWHSRQPPARVSRRHSATTLAARAVYGEAAGIARILPRAVAVPADADDARHARALGGRDAHAARAARIGEQHGRRRDRRRRHRRPEPARRDRVRRTSRGARSAAGPAPLRDAVDRAARAVGLRFPVDPSSGAFCTVGGMASTNAAGAHTLRYGATRAVGARRSTASSPTARAASCGAARAPPQLADRRSARSTRARARARRGARVAVAARRRAQGLVGLRARRLRARPASLVDLLVGSEGTLALIVGLELRLAPLLPHSASVLGAFASLEDAVVAADARAAGGRRRVRAARPHLPRRRAPTAAHRVPVPDDAEAVLLAEVEASTRRGGGPRWRARSRRSSAPRARRGAARARSRRRSTRSGSCATRRARSSSRLDPVAQVDAVHRGRRVPPDRLPEYVRGVRAALERQRIARRDLRARRRRARAREPARSTCASPTGGRASRRCSTR